MIATSVADSSKAASSQVSVTVKPKEGKESKDGKDTKEFVKERTKEFVKEREIPSKLQVERRSKTRSSETSSVSLPSSRFDRLKHLPATVSHSFARTNGLR